jgi:STE24 endopeptidase
MHWLTVLFLLLVFGKTAMRLWLATRQIAAVQAHRNRVPEQFRERVPLQDHQKAADYTAARARHGRWLAVADAFAVLALTVGGGIAALDAAWARIALGQPWHGVLVVLSVLAALLLIQLPFSIRRTFWLEARFGFNCTTPALFAADLAKRIIVATLLGVPLLLGALLLMERAGVSWWLYAWLGWLGFTSALTWAWPRFIAPLFNRFAPLGDEALKARVKGLLQRCGFHARGVYVMDGSRRSTHGNAYFTGIGRNKRIVFFDTLLARLSAAEIEAVLAHELGHFRLHHVRQRLALSALGSLAGFALLAWLAGQAEFYSALGVPTPSTHAALLLFMMAGPVVTFFATPLAASWSRRQELEADDFAARHSDARALAAALVQLYRSNATALTPDHIHSAFYDSHPPAPARIARLVRSAGPGAPV